MFRELSAPIAVQWEITSACPKRCFYCANYWRHNSELISQPAVPPRKLLERIVDQIISARVFSVTITGGEPLLVIEHCAPSLRRLTEAGITLSLNSTMVGLTPELTAILTDLGIKSALVSIPSFDPKTDALITNSASSWRNTAAGIGTAVKAGIRIKANMVVCRHNVSQIFMTAKYAKDLGIKDFAATKMSHPSSDVCLGDAMLTRDEFQFMASELKRVKAELGINVDSVQAYAYCGIDDNSIREDLPIFNKTCSAARTFCMVAPNGEVRPCPLVSDVYGNVADNNGLVNAWRAMKSWRDDSLLPKQCLECGHKTTCAGGCKADGKHSGGSYGSPDPYCNFKHMPVLPKKISLEKKKLQSSYEVNPKLRFRTESFGGVVFVRGLRWCATDQALYAALQKPSARYSVSDFARAMKIPDVDAEHTMRFLIGKGVLVESKN